MHQLGLDVQLAATEEDGTVEENAKIIARIVRAESRFHTKLILVSTSKGGPETALALGKILEPGETTSVKAANRINTILARVSSPYACFIQQERSLPDRVMARRLRIAVVCLWP